MAEGVERRVQANGTVSYRATVEVREHGRRVRARATLPTLALARQWRAAKFAEIQRGVRLVGTSQTVREALAALAEGMASGSIRTRTGQRYKPSTIRGYQQAGREYIDPVLGAARLAKIARRDIQTLVDDLLQRGLEGSTIRNAIKPLQAICRRAVEDGDLAVNPAIGLRLPSVSGKRDRIATPTQAALLITALPPGERALWAAAFYGGLRLGELRALDWQNVSLADGEIHIASSLDYGGERIEPKTRAGARIVPIVGPLRTALEDHHAETSRSAGYVFGSSATTPAVPNTIYRRASRAWQAASLEPIGLHEARHTFASFLIAAGANAKAISIAMGHSSIAVTYDIYGHLMPGARDELRDRLDEYLRRADTRGRLRQLGEE